MENKAGDWHLTEEAAVRQSGAGAGAVWLDGDSTVLTVAWLYPLPGDGSPPDAPPFDTPAIDRVENLK